jgi:hypothetical protein
MSRVLHKSLKTIHSFKNRPKGNSCPKAVPFNGDIYIQPEKSREKEHIHETTEAEEQ